MNHPPPNPSPSTIYPSIYQHQFTSTSDLFPYIRRQRHHKSLHRKQKFLKLICLAFLLAGFFSYRFGNTLNITTNCILDVYQEYTFNVNRKLADGWDNVAIGIGQVIMDGWIVSSGIFWYVLFGYYLQVWDMSFSRMLRIKNFRLPGAVLLFYLIRTGFLLVEKFPFPQYMVWHSPGFLSLTVPYDHTRDFYYSGHTGAMTLILLEFSQLTVKNGRKVSGYIWIFAFVCLIYMMNMLIITRVHYTADVVGGLIFSVYFYWLVSEKLYFIDKAANLPYLLIIKPLIKKLKTMRQKQKSPYEKNLINNNDDNLFRQQFNS